MKSLKKTTEQLAKEIKDLKKQLARLKKSEASNKTAKEYEKRFKILFDNYQAPITILKIDGTILLINRVGAKNLGGKPGDCIGKSIYDFLPKIKNILIKRFKNIIETGRGSNFEDEIELPSGKKQFFWTNVQPLKDKNGDTYAIQTISQDITDRKKIEYTLQKNEEKLSSLISNIQGMFYRGKADWTTEFVFNSDIVSGYPAEDFNSGKINWLDIIHPEDKNLVYKNGANLTAKRSSITQEYRIIDKYGQIRWVSDQKTSLFGPDGIFKGVDGIVYDITKRKEAEEALQESELNYRTIFNSVNDIIVVHDIETGRPIDINKKIKEVFGWSSEEFLRLRIEDWSYGKPPYSQQEAIQLIHKAAEGKPQLFEWLCKGKDGRLFWVEVNLIHANILGKEHVLAVARDISDRKKTEEELRESEEKYRLLSESAQDHIFIIDKDLKIRYLNRFGSRQFGFNRKKIIGKRLDEIFPRNVFERFKNNLQKVFEKGKSFSFEDNIAPMDKEVWLDTRLVPIKTKSGEIKSVLGISRDITDRKQTEETIRKSEFKHRALLNVNPDLMFELDNNGIFLSYKASHEEDLYVSADQFMGKKIRDIFPKNLASVFMEKIKQTLKSNKVCLLEYDLTIKGDLRNFESRYIKSGENRVLIIVREITERKRAEEILKRDRETFEKLVDKRTTELVSIRKKLEDAKRLSDIGMLASTIAHELRNPLNVIRLAVFSLRANRKDLAHDRHLNNIEKKIMESDKIIRNLLGYSRIKMPDFEQINIIQVLDECIAHCKQRYATYSVTLIKKYLCRKCIILNADLLQISELFSNILDNAYQSFPSKKGRINVTINCNRKKGFFSIDIHDNGIGIDEKDMPNILEPFFTKKSSGIGLGLSICHQIIKLHDGEIKITSKKGSGTTVKIILPLKKE